MRAAPTLPGLDKLGRARSTCVRRRPEDTVLHRVVREYLGTFLAEARPRGGGEGLPRFAEVGRVLPAVRRRI